MGTRRFFYHVSLATGATLGVFIASLQLSWVGWATITFTPFPVMVVCYLWDLRAGVLVALLGSLILSAVFGLLVGAIFLVEFGLLGIFLYHWIATRRLRWDRGIVLSSLIVLVMVALLMVVYARVTSSSLTDWMRGEIHQAGRAVLQLHATDRAGNLPTGIDLGILTEFVLRIFPALTILTIWAEGILNVSLFAWVTARMAPHKERVRMNPEFSNWICPDRLVWAGIVGGFLIVTKKPLLVTIGINTVIVLIAVYFLQGTAIVSFFFKKRNIPSRVRVIVYLLLGIFQFLLLLIAALGLLDIWMDFRKLRARVATCVDSRSGQP
jgi:uncharacterized protein YybS (DUF2232 family)